MNTKNFLLKLLFMAVCTLLTLQAAAQKTNPEEELARIRVVAFEGRFSEAEKYLNSLLDSFPAYGDARILLARVYAWQQQYEKGLGIVEELLADEPENSDAIEAKGDILRWMAGAAAEAEEAASRERAATEKAIQDSLKASSRNEIIAGYYFDTFREPYSRFWQVWKAGASHRTDYGKVMAYVNVGHIRSDGNGETEFQLEAEAWPVISPSVYGWVNYAWSPGRYFPGHRASAELWYTLGGGWVASGGLNYYYFDRNIFISVVGAEKYLGNWWFNGRVYFYFKDSGITSSFFMNVRRYFNDTDYLQLTAGTGTAPDEPFDVLIDLERLSATTVKLIYNRDITDKMTLRAGIGYSREEFSESLNRNRFEGTVTLTRKIIPKR